MSIQTIHCSTGFDALQALTVHPQAHVFGGGTLIMRAVNEADPAYSTLLRVTDPQLKQISMDGDQLVIGAAVTMNQLIAHRDAAFLHYVARRVGGPAVRNMATVGGNLFAASPYGDITTALLAMQAELTLEGQTQRLSIEQFLAQRAAGTHIPMLVRDIRCRRPASAADFRFHKVCRVKPKGISVMAMAAHLPGSGGTLQGVSVAYGAMAAVPLRMTGVEQALEGRRLDAASIEAAVQHAVDGLTPPTDALATSWYRTQVAPVHLRRLLETGGH